MKKFLTIYTITAFFLLFSSLTSAVEIPNPVSGSFIDNFNRLTSLLKPITTLMLLGVILLGGFTILTGTDNPEKIKKGWMTLLTGIVGTVIIFLAPSVVSLVGNLFGVDLISFL